MIKSNACKLFYLQSLMSSVTRYSRDELTKEESNLEHTGWMCLFCLCMYKQMEQLEPEIAKYIDLGKLLAQATIHDLDEAVTGDIPRTTKYASATVRDAIKEVEGSALRWVDNHLGTQSTLSELWSSAKSGPEGALVAMADMSAVSYKCWYEILSRSNQGFARVAIELKATLYSRRDEFFDEFTQYGPVLELYLRNLYDEMTTIVDESVARCADAVDYVASPMSLDIMK